MEEKEFRLELIKVLHNVSKALESIADAIKFWQDDENIGTSHRRDKVFKE